MTAITQGDRAAALIAATRALDARALTIHETTSPAALVWQPPDGGWSVGQVFEHLCIASDDYLVTLRRLLANPPARSHAANRWKPSLAGRILVRSFESSRRLPAPKMWRPAPAARPNVVQEFLARQHELVELIERSMAFEWNRVRLASPVSSLVRMNVGDAFAILVTHAERHFRQIDRVRTAAIGAIGVRFENHRSNASEGEASAGHSSESHSGSQSDRLADRHPEASERMRG
ncbi:MAG TPA: DinB family protein [Gemmatimonadaceae bacterium]|jgi:hypothetical protein|nr:DinB family protein [Gemmatimonadaceae bacterium]